MRSALPSPAQGTSAFISCKLKICHYHELECAGLRLAQGRTDQSVSMTDRHDRGAFLTRNMVTVALPPTAAAAAKGCGLQTPASSYEPTPSQHSSRWLCNQFWGKLFTVNVEETHFLIGIIQINLATPTIKCQEERALFKSCVSPPKRAKFFLSSLWASKLHLKFFLAVVACLIWAIVVPCYRTGSVCRNHVGSGFVIKLFQFFQLINDELLPCPAHYTGDPMYVFKTFSKTKKSSLQRNDL